MASRQRSSSEQKRVKSASRSSVHGASSSKERRLRLLYHSLNNTSAVVESTGSITHCLFFFLLLQRDQSHHFTRPLSNSEVRALLSLLESLDSPCHVAPEAPFVVQTKRSTASFPDHGEVEAVTAFDGLG